MHLDVAEKKTRGSSNDGEGGGDDDNTIKGSKQHATHTHRPSKNTHAHTLALVNLSDQKKD